MTDTTFLSGARLACELLREARRREEEGTEEGAPPLGDRLMQQTLRQLAEQPSLVDGFDAVLTDVLKCAMGGCVPDLKLYENAARGLRLVHV